MALPGPLQALLRGRFGYDWRTQEVDIGGTDFMHKMSGEAREFIWLAAGSPSENKRLTLKQQYGHPWRDDPLLISRWRKLPQTAQLETLVFVMSEVHEVIHHVDFLCTPFAVNLHTKLMREYWALQDFAPFLLKRPELMPSRLIEFEAHAARIGLGPNDPARRRWRNLQPGLMSLLAYGDGRDIWPHQGIEIGWAGDRDPIYLFGEPFEKIRVNGFFASLRPVGETSWYLRPLSFMETRAVANMVAWAVEFVGDGARPRIAELIRILYRSEAIAADYLAILDLFSRGFGYKDFEAVILDAPELMFRQVWIVASGLGWYALHATALRQKGDLPATNPVFRFINAVKEMENLLGEVSPKFRSMASSLEDFDRTGTAQQLQLGSAAESLEHARKLVVELAELNSLLTKHEDMRAHFAKVLERTASCLKVRGDVYASGVGMPEDGNPLSAAELDDKNVAEAIGTDLDPAPSVREWFKVRDDILFSFRMPQSKKIRTLFDQFGVTVVALCFKCRTVLQIELPEYRKSIKCPKCGNEIQINEEHRDTTLRDSYSTEVFGEPDVLAQSPPNDYVPMPAGTSGFRKHLHNAFANIYNYTLGSFFGRLRY